MLQTGRLLLNPRTLREGLRGGLPSHFWEGLQPRNGGILVVVGGHLHDLHDSHHFPSMVVKNWGVRLPRLWLPATETLSV